MPSLAEYLADDYHLGRQVARLGKRIVFCPVVVQYHETPAELGAGVGASDPAGRATIRVCRTGVVLLQCA